MITFPPILNPKTLSCIQVKAEQVQEGVRVLGERLRAEVVARQPQLMDQVAALKGAETAMQVAKP
jgi:hypothetical protein